MKSNVAFASLAVAVFGGARSVLAVAIYGTQFLRSPYTLPSAGADDMRSSSQVNAGALHTLAQLNVMLA
ncbi:hypothetical protein M407DRAFT_27052 [Tulasnella calospora MUT 4182]|uniref:Uncharacterized protein n=1 Tax=Tulasnella calospora MUT 4182 TaxID=1051891 RepID=A0A0C3QD43_9AGAM|nr:hypothetical protein M407DRAFT_27052 [Tulasnella calospora MUT 4182]